MLVIDSAGGLGQVAYQIARMLQRHCQGFVAVVPRYAKSAATLLVLGAGKIYLGADAELGPLDAQFIDPEREGRSSALDEVQALERLHSAALDEIDNAMTLLLARTGKRVDTLMPMVMKFEADMMKPLFDKIDTVHYTQQSRVLKVAEDYAVRLLQPKYQQERAERIARRLVNAYSEHEFVIDVEEARTFMDISVPSKEQAEAIEALEIAISDTSITAIGELIEEEVPI